MSDHDNSQLELAHNFVHYTDLNIFLTGKAGTGKTTFLRKLREESPKRMIVTAPTGVAAINAGGVTIHSFFQLPFGPQIIPKAQNGNLPEQTRDINKFSKDKVNILRSLDLLVIDEISMVRADLLDAVDRVLRRYKNHNRPFGGVQLLMIGDLQQLTPVAKEEDWEILKAYYDTPFFFSSLALNKTRFISIELQHIYRQNDALFIDLLNKIRDNRLDQEAIHILNSRYIADFEPKKEDGYITLTTHNQQANRINFLQMNRIDQPSHTFSAEVSGTFPEYSYPTEQELILKAGAQVMFIKNDTSHDKRYYNGKIGTVQSIEDDIVYVSCPGEKEIATEPVEWHNYTYTINEKTEEITENLIGTFKQMPLKPAWAITIHKSQGLTFEKAIIDASAAFAHGQVYVALSRCRTLEGIILSSKIDPHILKSDNQILGFMQQVENNQPNEQLLQESRMAFEQSLLAEINDFTPIQRRLSYCNKLVKDNEHILQDQSIRVCKAASDAFKAAVIEVSGKFTGHLNQFLINNPDVETNKQLQERLSQACNYYSEKTQLIFKNFFEQFILETDNKAVKKSIKETLNKLENEVNQKVACLEAVKSGFHVSSYLQVRGKASIEKAGEKTERIVPKSSTERVSEEILHPELYLLLRQWRNQKADDLNLPVYLILPQKTLIELTDKLPKDTRQLKSVKGFGDKKVKQFGRELLSIIAGYCEKNGLKKEGWIK